MAEFLMQHVWIIAFSWSALYLSDYYLTIFWAKRMRATLQPYIEFEGSLELTPVFQKDIDQLRMFSKPFLLRLGLSFVVIYVLYFLAVVFLGMPQFFYFALGGLFLREATVHLRHFRNLALERFARNHGSLQGKIQYSRWLTLRTSAADLWAFAAFYLIIALVSPSWFFLGGAVFSGFTGFQHWRLSLKLKPALASAVQPSEPA